MQASPSIYQSFLNSASIATQEKEVAQQELNNKSKALEKLTNFDTRLRRIVKTMDVTNELKAKVETINMNRQEFIHKYVDNRYYQVAVVVLGLAMMALGITAVYNAVTLSQAWIDAPKGPGFGYSNFETLLFYGFMSFGLGFIIAAAIPGVPIVLGAMGAGYGLRIAVSPKEFMSNFAPDASKDERDLSNNCRHLLKALHINQSEFEALLERYKELNSEEEKKQFLIEQVLHINMSLEHLKLELEHPNQKFPSPAELARSPS